MSKEIEELKAEIAALKKSVAIRAEYTAKTTESNIKLEGNATVNKTGVLLGTSVIALPNPNGTLGIQLMGVIKPDEGGELIVTNAFKVLE